MRFVKYYDKEEYLRGKPASGADISPEIFFREMGCAREMLSELTLFID